MLALVAVLVVALPLLLLQPPPLAVLVAVVSDTNKYKLKRLSAGRVAVT